MKFLIAFSLLVAVHATFAADAPKKVVVFGDSITQGSAMPKEDKPKVWVTTVQGDSRGRLEMINEGKGGRPTDSVKEFEAMLQRQPKADILVIALGTNDSRDITDKCVPKAVANVKSMVEKGRTAYGAKLAVLLVGPPNINKNALGPTKPIANERDGKLVELGAAFEKQAKEMNAEFVTLYGVVPANALTKDGVHPDVSGNAAIAEVMLAKLMEMVK
ncbi:acyl-CoA thioesterase-1 [Roseimicrobium gellanilyticum]|uniref:Acyl-CoA thioesterase-1 n=1 Tax=Roseimicrobium gellanilyticum TaxID=748857 RepID=A0A366HL90_9BACT|nr:SGNH/GDSL hydrolase family protein [Roseimicrobium gellanilyticum]RBP43700.1 acyl-CoA thioesterase-1 [Roseimicrobium gellanilyticum]